MYFIVLLNLFKCSNMFSDSFAKEIVEVGEMINEQIIETGVWNGTVDTSQIFN